ncbi:MAG: exodeoxyribonuclease V subunit gamma [Rhodocyclaceae bacterium]|nr:exodeoxyribonuclease V subunit gamma [Rhodocyclaceae bacterium]
MFSLIHSNRQDLLAQLLSARLRARPPMLFEPEVVVVQSAAMERWLRLFLAEELGIAAQLRFPLPAGYIWELFGAVLDDVPAVSPLAAAPLHWRLLRLLGEIGSGDALWAPVRRYLGDGDVQRRDALAEQLTAVFERYLAYRPDWLAAWGRRRLLGLGVHEAWQAALWRALIAELPHLPEAHPRERFFAALERDPRLLARLPPRISLFGIGAMPPPYFEIFSDLGRHREVTLYLLNPCREFWGHIVASRVEARAALDGRAIHLETGHPLLGSLGATARQFFDLAAAACDDPIAAFEEVVPCHRLARLQADMLALREPAAEQAGAAEDISLQVHVCHSPQREVDVLYDRLLALFEAVPDLTPSQVLVLTPDMETYAPLIDARFAHRGESGQDGAPSIPYTIADRPPGAGPALERAFAALLDLAAGRLDAENVLAFLEQSSVARRMGFTAAALERLRDWVRRAAIRWGVDGAWRGARGLPVDDAHSWRQGFERLLLGLALPADSPLPFRERLPATDIEGSATRDLGRFIDFGEALFAAHDELNRAHPPADWAALLDRLLLRFFDSESDLADARHAQRLRSAWGAMAETAAAACAEPVPLAVVRRSLDQTMQAADSDWAFFGGGVTFAALRAHRALPVRVLCLLGLNDGEYPRNPALPGFDLIGGHPRAGDRVFREEDRHAFLEALLAARDVLHISYVGRDIRDNAELPPSALVDELLDAVNPAGEALPGLVFEHPLQAFSPRYFHGRAGDLYSYERAYAAASRAAVGTPQARRPFLAQPLPIEEAPATAASLDGLIRFLHNPAKSLLRERLGIHLEESEGLIESSEPFVLAGLERYDLDRLIVERCCAGGAAADVLALARAHGALPHGRAGEAQFMARWQALGRFAEQVAAYRLPGGSADFAFAAGGLHLGGRLDGLVDGAQVLWRPATEMSGRDWLRLWVRHLALQVADVPERPRSSRFLTLKGEATLGPLEQAVAAEALADLLALWQQGRCELLPFFPDTALAYAEEKGAWRSVWRNERGRSEADDPWFDLAFAAVDPLDEAFEQLALRVYGPLLAARYAGG